VSKVLGVGSVVEACGGFRTLVSRNTKDRELRMASRELDRMLE
jgi:hypothetical protein